MDIIQYDDIPVKEEHNRCPHLHLGMIAKLVLAETDAFGSYRMHAYCAKCAEDVNETVYCIHCDEEVIASTTIDEGNGPVCSDCLTNSNGTSPDTYRGWQE